MSVYTDETEECIIKLAKLAEKQTDQRAEKL